MSTWKTVIQVDTTQEAYVIRAQLELGGFEVFIKDELSSQLNSKYSIASGGPRVQVLESDWEKATECLIELGHITPQAPKKSKWIHWIINFTSKIPVVKKMRFEARLILFVAVIALAVILPVSLNNIPPEKNVLTNSMWCITEVKHNGKVVLAERGNLVLTMNGCANFINFHDNTFMHLPPYGDKSVEAYWSISEKKITFKRAGSDYSEGQQNLLLGTFNFYLKGNKLRLKSNETTILLDRMYY